MFVQQQRQLSEELSRVGEEAPDTWSALRAGCHAFLRLCLDQNVRRIVLIDGPAVLGWDVVREIEYGYALQVLQRGVRAALADGWISEGDLDVRCQLLFGALCEAGLLLARADDPFAALPTVIAEADRLLNTLTLPAAPPEDPDATS